MNPTCKDKMQSLSLSSARKRNFVLYQAWKDIQQEDSHVEFDDIVINVQELNQLVSDGFKVNVA